MEFFDAELSSLSEKIHFNDDDEKIKFYKRKNQPGWLKEGLNKNMKKFSPFNDKYDPDLFFDEEDAKALCKQLNYIKNLELSLRKA